MTITVEATFENGQLRPKQPLAIAEGTPVHLTITYDVGRDPFAGIVGAVESGRADGAQNHDQYLYGKRS